jgi:hypothetical protein
MGVIIFFNIRQNLLFNWKDHMIEYMQFGKYFVKVNELYLFDFVLVFVLYIVPVLIYMSNNLLLIN